MGGPRGHEAELSCKSAVSKSGRVQSARLALLTTEKELRAYDAKTQQVPKSLREATVFFFTRKSIVLLYGTAMLAALWRTQFEVTAADGLVLPAVALWWMFQEWFIHAQLLHSPSSWWGQHVHLIHHKMPYHHVCVDGLGIIGATMLVSVATFRYIFQQSTGLFLTATFTYYVMGLLYEWTHFLVHTRVPMQSYFAKIIKRAHQKHHLRDEHFWFSFTCPPIDNLMGTTPVFNLVG